MRKFLCVAILVMGVIFSYAQTGIQGVVRNASTGEGVPDVQVMLKKQAVFTFTDELGMFVITDIQAGTDILEIVHPTYSARPLQITIINKWISFNTII